MDEHAYDEVVSVTLHLSPVALRDLEAVGAHLDADAATAVRVLCEVVGNAVRAQVHGREAVPAVLAAVATERPPRADETEALAVDLGWVQAGGLAQAERSTSVRRDVVLAGAARAVAAALPDMPEGRVVVRYRRRGARRDEGAESWSRLGGDVDGEAPVDLRVDPLSGRAVAAMVLGMAGVVLLALGLSALVLAVLGGDAGLALLGAGVAAVGALAGLPWWRRRADRDPGTSLG